MADKAERIWHYGDIDVIYEPAVDGGGMRSAPPLIAFIQKRFGKNRRFGTVFEWCAGPGFIGFGLLAEDMCDSLCLADLNPKAIECVNKTVRANNLQGRVRAYVSDNMRSVPEHERFDLVVGNPPSFCALNPAHPFYVHLDGNMLSHDPDWRIRSDFYRQITPFLNPKAQVVVLEVNMHDRQVFTPRCSVPLDVRPENPQLVFAEMIRKSGLTYIEDAPLGFCWEEGINFWVQITQKCT